MRGRRPTPTALKLVAGNPGRRPLPTVDSEMRPESAIPDCPAHLKGAARLEWDRVTVLLHELGVIAEIDAGGLAMLSTQWGRYVDAEVMMEKAIIKSPNGFDVQSPWLAVSNRAQEAYKSWCSEFGLTPAARVRLVPMTSPQEELFGGDGDVPEQGTERFFSS